MRDLEKLFLHREGVAYLNHGSFGSCPIPVFDTYQRLQRELEAEPIEFLGRRFPAMMKESREALGAFIGADAEDIAFVPNATTGLNIVARSLELKPGDEILTTDHEYGALDKTWKFICNKTGAVYKRIQLPFPLTTEDDFINRIWSGKTDRTKILFISHITSPTGLFFPIETLLKKAKSEGIMTIVDGAHAPGQVPLNLRTLDADVYSGNCHKWLNTPKGCAFLYVAKKLQPEIDPLVISWGWEKDPPSLFPFIDMLEWPGTHDCSAYLSLPEAVRFYQEHDWNTVRTECKRIVLEAHDRILKITKEPPIAVPAGNWMMQMAANLLPEGINGPLLQERLFNEYNIEIPVFPMNGRFLIRVSVQGYNTPEDIDRYAHALSVLLDDMRSGKE